ncbi:MAG: outer membrane beta-barrel protein [Terracidiphilus sp.]
MENCCTRSVRIFFCVLLAAAAVSARAQVVPAASSRTLAIDAGGLGSVFQPDYADQVNDTGQGIAGTSPNRLYGFGAYVDARFTRWVQIEAEGRWLHYNQYLGIDENTYLIGPRVPIHNFHGWTPYGKVLFGWGSGSFLSGRAGAIAFGGGVDYRLTRKLTLRAFDFEYQRLSVTPTLWPYGGSVGLSYRVF